MTVGVTHFELLCLLLCAIISTFYWWGYHMEQILRLLNRLLLYNMLMLDFLTYVRTKPVQHNHLSLIYLFDNIQCSLLTALLCRSCSSCCTHYFDSMISILLYHHAVYHVIYSASPPCNKTQRLLSVLFKDKTKHREYTRTYAYVDIYTRIYT